MPTLLRCLQRICLSAISAIFLFPTSGEIAGSQASRLSHRPAPDRRVRMVVYTDHEKYSSGDSLTINALLENTGDNQVYVDRRMFWTGLSGGLKLVISDERGHFLPAQPFSDAMMPAPRPGTRRSSFRSTAGFYMVRHYAFWLRASFPSQAGTPSE